MWHHRRDSSGIGSHPATSVQASRERGLAASCDSSRKPPAAVPRHPQRLPHGWHTATDRPAGWGSATAKAGNATYCDVSRDDNFRQDPVCRLSRHVCGWASVGPIAASGGSSVRPPTDHEMIHEVGSIRPGSFFACQSSSCWASRSPTCSSSPATACAPEAMNSSVWIS
jgi:hypothetical protein